ncbi:hypothetical protein SCP_0114970 [Sparassis crispa]|uniref:Uncharacterized protein n=1 Tax=Sparassis crispa TaxID=139825 RepID=A0A401G8X5_9APHY|nr:hypothetical protein SCP_0114970 [Sparassis crispa]GBE78608.1 hypothetical protein SCP_0114970 [Sparassis crispa]
MRYAWVLNETMLFQYAKDYDMFVMCASLKLSVNRSRRLPKATNLDPNDMVACFWLMKSGVTRIIVEDLNLPWPTEFFAVKRMASGGGLRVVSLFQSDFP